MNSARNSEPARVFHNRTLPEPAQLAGYAWLIERYGLKVPLPSRLAGISAVHHTVDTPSWLLLTPRHAPEPTLADHLTFSAKWEGIDLSVLKALANVVPTNELEVAIRATPNGQYMLRHWFLFEWLTGKTLDVPDSGTKRSIVLALDPDQQCALIRGELSARHRVQNNLPGTPAFCPLVKLTPGIERARARQLDQRVREVIGRTSADVIARAAAFLQLSDSKASFAIEKETPSPDRTARWARAIGRAGVESVSAGNLVALQRVLIEDARFVAMGLRTEGGFIGEHDRDTRAPLPEHVSARHQDLVSLMHGIEAYDTRVREHGFDPVVAAASLAFGFVYIHPFVDGNGRLHRWLIHHVLAAMNYTPDGVVFPVSEPMLREIATYKRVLESYSCELLPHIRWEPTDKGNVEVLNETADFYRYFDATVHAEFVYHCVEETVDRDLPNEVAWLHAYDRFVGGVQEVVDMPSNTVDLLHTFLRQNKGRLSARARDKEFKALSAHEVESIERLFSETTGAL